MPGGSMALFALSLALVTTARSAGTHRVEWIGYSAGNLALDS
tara:strand:+ start:2537 stop:2662 length:126 start_codon:yes stop_codon:yes gene_type:complete